jgi:ABC-type nickel/cobalt efflux system permease component RcnA
MRNIFLGAALLAVAAMLGLWMLGGFDQLSAWAASGQRSFQNQMAASLRALRTGQPGALATLLAVCFAYGFFHAVGPGHGKFLIGGYGVATRVAMWRLSGIALLSSLAQGASAVILVYTGVLVLGLTRTQMVDSAENIFAPVSYGAIALVGLWLIIRGFRKYMHQRQTHDHDHTGHGDTCDSCGHRHGPTPEEADNIHSLRDLVVLVGAIAIRPCTGALFLLILTWRFGLVSAGIAGTFAMALGTASVTIAVAVSSTFFRNSTLRGLSGSAAARVVPAIEILAGLIISVGAVQLLQTTL